MNLDGRQNHQSPRGLGFARAMALVRLLDNTRHTIACATVGADYLASAVFAEHHLIHGKSPPTAVALNLHNWFRFQNASPTFKKH